MAEYDSDLKKRWAGMLRAADQQAATRQTANSTPNEQPSTTKPSNEAPATRCLELSSTKRYILRALKELDAVSNATKVNSTAIGNQTKMAPDARLRAELASLRDLDLLGGDKGTRGYWLTTAGQQEAERV